MKKIIIAIIFALMSIYANAQLSYRDGTHTSTKFVHSDYSKGIKAHTETKTIACWFIEFKLGDYIFVGDSTKFIDETEPSVVGGMLNSNYDKNDYVWGFIKKNKEKIEKKFNVVIKEINPPFLTVYDAEDYKEMMAAVENINKMAREYEQKRQNSLNNIF